MKSSFAPALLWLIFFPGVMAADKPAIIPSLVVECWFAPAAKAVKGQGTGPQWRLIECIKAEKSWIRVQAYALTKTPLVDALLAAKARGVDVRVILDNRWQKANGKSAGPVVAELLAAKIPVLLDSTHPIAHAKFMVFGAQELVEIGSYNYTAQAEHNHETALFIRDAITFQQFRIDWQNHADHSPTAP